MARYKRPNIPYNPPEILVNNNRYELLTDKGYPVNPDIMDGEANYLISALNDLYIVTQTVAAGVIFGANLPINEFKFPVTNGANVISWTKVTEVYYADNSISTVKLKLQCVDDTILANGAVANNHIQDGAIKDNNINDNEISFNKIKNEDSTSFQQFYNNQPDDTLNLAPIIIEPKSISGEAIDDNSLPAASIVNGSITSAQLSASVQFYVGMMMDWTVPGDPPPAWIIGDGQPRLIATYPALAAKYGTTYPGGDGVNTFGIPDTRGVAMFGIAPATDAPTNGKITEGTIAIGETGGVEKYALNGDENGPHTHTYSQLTTVFNVQSGAVANNGRIEPTNVQTSSSGTGAPHQNMPPYMLMPKIIYTGVL